MPAKTFGTVALTFVLAVLALFAFLVHTASAALVFPTVADLEPHALFTTDESSTVYYFGNDEKRYTFPNLGTYMSWYSDFDDVVTISAEDMADISWGGVVTYKPQLGNETFSRLVKLQSVPVVYMVDQGAVLTPIEDEAAAKQVFGEDWADLVDDLPDAFFTSYTVSEEMITTDTVLSEAGFSYFISNDLGVEGDQPAGVFLYSEPNRFTATDESEECEEDYCAYNEVTVKQGLSVKFVNYTEETLTVREENNLWSTGEMAPEDIVILTIDDEEGTYTFVADEDEDMMGVLIVE